MMEETIRRLKEKGVITTSQRIEILEYIKKNMDHPTADDVFHAMKDRFPTMSLATVYNILEKFVEVGEIRQLSIRREKACFDGETHIHHHLFCNACGRIVNLPANGHDLKAETSFVPHRIEDVQAYFYGTCSACVKKESA